MAKPDIITLGLHKPAQNGFIERFNRTYRNEVLSAYVFESLDQVREISADWLLTYNEVRPHDALAGLPPATYRAQLNAESSPLPVSRGIIKISVESF